jgi:hypothetical protein
VDLSHQEMLRWYMLSWHFSNVVSAYAGRTVEHLTYKQNLAVILVLTAYKWFYDYRDSEIQTSIVTTVYGGSMLYMMCIIGV